MLFTLRRALLWSFCARLPRHYSSAPCIRLDSDETRDCSPKDLGSAASEHNRAAQRGRSTTCKLQGASFSKNLDNTRKRSWLARELEQCGNDLSDAFSGTFQRVDTVVFDNSTSRTKSRLMLGPYNQAVQSATGMRTDAKQKARIIRHECYRISVLATRRQRILFCSSKE